MLNNYKKITIKTYQNALTGNIRRCFKHRMWQMWKYRCLW